jgi:hypothetical protein
MKRSYEWFKTMIAECYKKMEKEYVPVEEKELDNNLAMVDEYIDCASDVFCKFGLQKDSEPNQYGMEMEEVISYLLSKRYKIVDK